MKKTLKKYFIPHEHNDYHPHILHTKRVVLYSSVFALMKVIVVAFALIVPEVAFVSTDALAIEEKKIMELTNDLRLEKQLPQLAFSTKLNRSANLKATDMSQHEYFSHTRPNGDTLAYFMDEIGYNYAVAGENLGMGYFDAQELFDAWLTSPTHYNNLVDVEYEENGLGIMGGLYEGSPTIYVAHHFGAEKRSAPSSVVVTLEVNETDPPADIDEPLAHAAEVLPTVAGITYNQGNSNLLWTENDSGLVLSSVADIDGDVETAFVEIKEHTIPLTSDGALFGGEIVLDESSDAFFAVTLPGTLVIEGGDGEIIKEAIAWKNPKVVQPTPPKKYSLAKNRLVGLTSLFDLSKKIYLGFLIFFALALALKIFVEIRRQHHHVIAQTVGLLVVLVVFYLF